MILTHNLDWLYEQLTDAKKNSRPYNTLLLEELEVLREDPGIKKGIFELYAQNRLPPVTGPRPSNCASCGKPLP
jgi:hypothetical protein